MQTSENPLFKSILESKIVAILRGLTPDTVVPAVNALCAGGLRLAEIPFDQSSPAGIENTLECIRRIRKDCPAIPGAGTVMTPEQVEMAAEAGAQYIISPNTDASVIRRTKELGLLSMPGAFTPTEIAAAYGWGADLVKVFPAGQLGPDYIKAVRAPLRHIPLMAVGGVDAKNAAAFLKAGCVGVGVGGSLVDRKAIAAGEFDALTRAAKALQEAVLSANL